MKRLLLIILFLTPVTAVAEIPAQLAQDFAPLSGYVVMPMTADEYLIDLDASKGVQTGDLFSIVRKGKKITHPVTGEIIGTLDGSRVFLQVTRLKSGYSYVRKIAGKGEVHKGDKIKRFNAIPVRYVDKTADSAELKSELQSELTQLDWLAAESEDTPLLLFERGTNNLTVKSSEGNILFNYPLNTKMPLKTQQSSPLAPAVAVTAPLASAPAPATQTATQGIIKNQTDTSRIWHGAQYKTEVLGLRVDDFNADGSQEAALLLEDKLIIDHYQGTQHSTLAEISLKDGLSYLAIDSIDLNGNGLPEIFLSAVRAGVPATRVFEFTGNKLQEIANKVPMLVRRIEHPQKGSILLGQKRHDLKVPFSERPFYVRFTQGQYEQGAQAQLPTPATIFGTTPLTTEEGSMLYAYLTASDTLKVKNDAGDEIFETSDKYGGSEVQFILESEGSRDDAIHYYLPLRVLFSNNEILIPQNEGQRMTQNWRRYSKSRLISLKWNGLSFDESWRTSDQSGQTADFALADIDNDGQTELILAVKFKRKTLFSSAKSALVIYEMH